MNEMKTAMMSCKRDEKRADGRTTIDVQRKKGTTALRETKLSRVTMITASKERKFTGKM
jgi:hypothetical protein